ncbi:hypothetical protein DSO57_1023595 [Entomophthora muscae]|uniref:Uncharacterized protein n=1 Tax=Entomophthora muscae TaxID=34485 RepID=A0ACC2SRQ4_9FUNG|nr:hypothetical protein DSO57_1023595 [Entomophthora muscae]
MTMLPTMKEIPLTPPSQDFSKLGIAPIVFMVFQARPASPVGVQLDSGMGPDNKLLALIVPSSISPSWLTHSYEVS